MRSVQINGELLVAQAQEYSGGSPWLAWLALGAITSVIGTRMYRNRREHLLEKAIANTPEEVFVRRNNERDAWLAHERMTRETDRFLNRIRAEDQRFHEEVAQLGTLIDEAIWAEPPADMFDRIVRAIHKPDEADDDAE